MCEFVPQVSPTYAAPNHLLPLVEALELSWTQSVRRTCHAPPRHGKTDTLLAFVALSLLRHPERTVAFISYEADVAKSKSRKARMWAEAAGVKLAEDSRRLNEWRTVQGGGLLAGGVGGPLTGQGVNCFVGDTLVTTEAGVMTISALYTLPITPRVLCFDHNTNLAKWGSIVARRVSRSSRLVDVVTESGRSVRCTDEHRFFVQGRGYRAASLLQRGDRLVVETISQSESLRGLSSAKERAGNFLPRLLSKAAKYRRSVRMRLVQKSNGTGSISHRQSALSRCAGFVLQHPMPLVSPSGQECARLHGLQVANAWTSWAKVLFSSLRGISEARKGGSKEDVRVLRECICPENKCSGVLQHELQEFGAFCKNDGIRKCSVHNGPKLRKVIRRNASVGVRTRRSLLRRLWQAACNSGNGSNGACCEKKQSCTTPYQRGRSRQLAREFDFAVCDMPRHASPVEDDTVAMVCPVRSREVSVYDIQVEEFHNFFAGEILVHNCLIVDDPYKNRLQAESAAYRSMVADWWNDVAETRIEPGGSAFVCHTRWLHDDLIGHIYSGAGSSIWQHLNLPALSDDGKALWPERWGAEALEAKRLAVGEYTWASLYQGEPRPRGGAVFEGDVVTYSELPTDNVRYAIGVDLAYSERTSSDYSVAVVMARSGDDYYVVDILRLQCSAPTFASRLKALCGQYTGAQLRWYAAGTELAAAQFFRTSGVPIVALNPKGDKYTRAMPIAAAWNRGAVRIARRPWADDFITELRSFTGVRDPHDDQVDALAAAYDALAVERPRVRRPEAATTDFEDGPIG